MNKIDFIKLDDIRNKSLNQASDDISFIENIFVDDTFLNEQKTIRENPIFKVLQKLNKQITIEFPKQYNSLVNKYKLNPSIENKEELNNFISNYNNSLIKINNIEEQINNVKSILNTLNNTSNNINISKNIINTALSFIPSPPGVPGFLVSALESLSTLNSDILLPRINEINRLIDNLSLYLKYILKKFNLDFNNLKQINVDFNLNNDLITNIENIINDKTKKLLINNDSYKDFILKIEEIPYNNKVKQRKAIALNSSNIPVIETNLSFTTNPKLLLDEIKILIDKNTIQ